MIVAREADDENGNAQLTIGFIRDELERMLAFTCVLDLSRYGGINVTLKMTAEETEADLVALLGPRIGPETEIHDLNDIGLEEL